MSADVPPGLFEIRDKDLSGRIGRLHTPHGKLETPALLPVIDVVRQEVPIDIIRELGFQAVITNAYLLWRRMRDVALEKGVHGILGFDGIVMTDSGAYQILQYGGIDADQETIIDFEKKIGSDIAVILDVPTGNARDRAQAEYSVKETLRRAEEAINLIDPEKRIWTLPVQGGQFLDLLELSARESKKLLGPYRLVALGSPTVLLERYDYATLIEMIAMVRRILPRTVPLHLFGAGHPMIIPYAVALGVDMFDSASYILYARDNRIMTATRTYKLEELEYMPCESPICVKYTPQELLEMPKEERVRLIATHNLYVLASTLNQVKQAIREGRLWELLEERSKAHPSLYRAFHKIVRHSDYMVAYTPRVKGGKAKGIFIYGVESLYHPRVLQHIRMLRERYRRPKGKQKIALIPVLEEYKPFTRSPLYLALRNKLHEEVHIVGYITSIAVIPEELAETYPLSQFETSSIDYKEVIGETASRILKYILDGGYKEVHIYACMELSWSTRLAETLYRALSAGGDVAVTLELLDTCKGLQATRKRRKTLTR